MLICLYTLCLLCLIAVSFCVSCHVSSTSLQSAISLAQNTQLSFSRTFQLMPRSDNLKSFSTSICYELTLFCQKIFIYFSLRLACTYLFTCRQNNANAFDLKCLSLNVRGLNKSIKCRTGFRWLHKQKLDVIFLQESYCSKEVAATWENEWGGKAIIAKA